MNRTGKDRRIGETAVLGRVRSIRTLVAPGCTIAVQHSIGQRMSGMRERSMTRRGQSFDLPHGPRSRKRTVVLTERRVTMRPWGKFVLRSRRLTKMRPSRSRWGKGAGSNRIRSVRFGASSSAPRRCRRGYACRKTIVRCSSAVPTFEFAPMPAVNLLMWSSFSKRRTG